MKHHPWQLLVPSVSFHFTFNVEERSDSQLCNCTPDFNLSEQMMIAPFHPSAGSYTIRQTVPGCGD